MRCVLIGCSVLCLIQRAIRTVKSNQVKSSQIFLCSIFHNRRCQKAALQKSGPGPPASKPEVTLARKATGKETLRGTKTQKRGHPP